MRSGAAACPRARSRRCCPSSSGRRTSSRRGGMLCSATSTATIASTSIATIVSRMSSTARPWRSSFEPSRPTSGCSGNTRWSSVSGAWPWGRRRGARAGRRTRWTSTAFSARRSCAPSRKRRMATSSGIGRSARTRLNGTSQWLTSVACSLDPLASCLFGRAQAKIHWRRISTPAPSARRACYTGTRFASGSFTAATWTCSARR
mmetsp:Transcript_67514/g.206751  ORF Transcript_67514/g.206751 Transcript_67514/m.206751 type:complete len:204 (+) Transcript_67514:612-1223(+)